MTFYINETADMGYSAYCILLDDTNELNAIADNIQKAKGKLPLFDDSGKYDPNDWYNFYLRCDTEGVKGMYFEYGLDMEFGDNIPMTDEDKAEAFKAVLDFFDGIDGYKDYIRSCECE